MLRSSQQISCALLVASLLAFAGCQPVREDRQITFSSDGKAVGFQHGADGVFVTGKDGTPKKIFQPANDVIATSTPLWATAGKRLVFTTATGLGKDPQPALPLLLGQRDNAAGRTFAQVPAKYTCWLRDEDADGPDAKPIPLFSANCDHVGYVAANLAVRWHPCENRLFFIDDKGTQQHALYEYDFASKTARSTFVPTADALLFDWSPDGTWLVCVLGSRNQNQSNDGIWIGKPDATDWWHVPNSNRFALPELPSLIEALRATKPAWTPDGSRFAFASHDPDPAPKKPGKHSLQLV